MLRHPVKLYQAMLGIASKGFDTVDMLHTVNKFIEAYHYIWRFFLLSPLEFIAVFQTAFFTPSAYPPPL